MEILAIAKLIANPDILGSSGRGCGVVVIEEQGELVAKAVKAGTCMPSGFDFKSDESKSNHRDIRFSLSGDYSFIRWEQLTKDQKCQFLDQFIKGLAMVEYEPLRSKLFKSEEIAGNVARKKLDLIDKDMPDHIRKMREIYSNDIFEHVSNFLPLAPEFTLESDPSVVVEEPRDHNEVKVDKEMLRELPNLDLEVKKKTCNEYFLLSSVEAG